jgi:hypothetical protein
MYLPLLRMRKSLSVALATFSFLPVSAFALSVHTSESSSVKVHINQNTSNGKTTTTVDTDIDGDRETKKMESFSKANVEVPALPADFGTVSLSEWWDVHCTDYFPTGNRLCKKNMDDWNTRMHTSFGRWLTRITARSSGVSTSEFIKTLKTGNATTKVRATTSTSTSTSNGSLWEDCSNVNLKVQARCMADKLMNQ